MTQAMPYTRTTGFADDERNNAGGRAAVRTANVDAEFDAVAQSLNPTIANLAKLQRDDGVMRDGCVPVTALGADTLKLLTTGSSTPRGAWVTGTAYATKDLVTQGGNTYICAIAHTSGTFATDLAAVKWILFQIGSNPAAASILFSPTVNVLSTNMQAAVAEVDSNARTREDAIFAALADTTDASKNSGSIGFNYALNYVSGTIGAWLKGLAGDAGTTFLGYLASWAGAKRRTQAQKNSDTLSILEFTGVDPAGASDSTVGIQAAIAAACVQAGDSRIMLWRKGTYLISGQISVGSNVAIVFEPGVIINYTGNVNTPLFAISNQTGVYFRCNGATFNGNRAGVTLTDSGLQTCFYVYGSDNVLIEDANISSFAYDGITLTGDTGSSGPCTNVRIMGCDVYNSGRNGLSIIHANGVLVAGGRYWNSNGTPSGPWAGIDVEPNSGESAKDIQLIGVRTQNNNGAGLQFTPGAMSLSAGSSFDVLVSGGRSTGDGAASTGAVGIPALYFANGGAQVNEVGGQVIVENYEIEGPNAMGVGAKNWDAVNSPRVILDNVLVINPNANNAATGNPNQSGFVLYCDSSNAVSSLGKFTLRNCKAEDNRGSPKMVIGCYLAADSGKTLQDVVVQDFVSVNYLSAGKYPVKTDLGGAGSLVDVVVSYTNTKPFSTAASISDPGWGGQRVNFTAVSTFTLPLAAKCKGLYYEVQADPGAGGNCTVARTSTDTIKALGVAGATSFTLQPGDCARFRSEGGTTWSVAAVA